MFKPGHSATTKMKRKIEANGFLWVRISLNGPLNKIARHFSLFNVHFWVWFMRFVSAIRQIICQTKIHLEECERNHWTVATTRTHVNFRNHWYQMSRAARNSRWKHPSWEGFIILDILLPYYGLRKSVVWYFTGESYAFTASHSLKFLFIPPRVSKVY